MLKRVTRAAQWVAALAVALALTACDFSSLMPKEQVDFAKGVVMLVQNRDAEGLEAVSDPILWQQLTPALRENMADMFPRGAASNVRISSYRSASNSDRTNVTITLVYEYPERLVQAVVSFSTLEHGYELTAIHVSPAGMPVPRDPTNSVRDS